MTTEVKVEGAISAPVEKVWALLRDFGDLSWGGIVVSRVEGEGVGTVRTFTATGGIEIQERLEILDDAAHSLKYTLLDSESLPWSAYEAEIRLSDEAGQTKLEWSAELEPKLPEESVQTIVRAIFQNGIENLKRATGG